MSKVEPLFSVVNLLNVIVLLPLPRRLLLLPWLVCQSVWFLHKWSK